VLLTDFGDNAILFRVDYWIDIRVEPNWRRVASESRRHVEELFTERGITIAFPQQDVHLDNLTPLKVEVVTHTTADGAGQAVQPA
jgi:small-conductance mechanosensitive channel